MTLQQSFPEITISTCIDLYTENASIPHWDLWEYLDEVESLVDPCDNDMDLEQFLNE